MNRLESSWAPAMAAGAAGAIVHMRCVRTWKRVVHSINCNVHHFFFSLWCMLSKRWPRTLQAPPHILVHTDIYRDTFRHRERDIVDTHHNWIGRTANKTFTQPRWWWWWCLMVRVENDVVRDTEHSHNDNEIIEKQQRNQRIHKKKEASPLKLNLTKRSLSLHMRTNYPQRNIILLCKNH